MLTNLILSIFLFNPTIHSTETIPSERIILSSKPMVRIGIVDSGFKVTDEPLCENKGIFYAIKGDNYKHGTNVMRLIKSEIHKDISYCFVLIKAIETINGIGFHNIGKGLEYALNEKVDILNLSFVGYQKDADETKYIQKLIENKVIIVNSIGNDKKRIDKDNCTAYPACLDDRIIAVGSKNPASNYGSRVDILFDGKYNGQKGTSFSAARVTGLLANVVEKTRELIYEKKR